MAELGTNPFKNYLVRRGEAPHAFANRSSVSRATVYKIFHTGKCRKDVAKKIVRHCNKELSLKDFGYD